jgi:hypothetical protein
MRITESRLRRLIRQVIKEGYYEDRMAFIDPETSKEEQWKQREQEIENQRRDTGADLQQLLHSEHERNKFLEDYGLKISDISAVQQWAQFEIDTGKTDDDEYNIEELEKSMGVFLRSETLERIIFALNQEFSLDAQPNKKISFKEIEDFFGVSIGGY